MTLGRALPGGRGGRSTFSRSEKSTRDGRRQTRQHLDQSRSAHTQGRRLVGPARGTRQASARHVTTQRDRDHRLRVCGPSDEFLAQTWRTEERQDGPNRAGRGLGGGNERRPGIGLEGKDCKNAPTLRTRRRDGGGGRSRARVPRRALQARAGRNRNPSLVILARRQGAGFGQKVELRDAGTKLMTQRTPLGADRAGRAQQDDRQKREKRPDSS